MHLAEEEAFMGYSHPIIDETLHLCCIMHYRRVLWMWSVIDVVYNIDYFGTVNLMTKTA